LYYFLSESTLEHGLLCLRFAWYSSVRPEDGKIVPPISHRLLCFHPLRIRCYETLLPFEVIRLVVWPPGSVVKQTIAKRYQRVQCGSFLSIFPVKF
jgi:hypothetical protein